MEIKDIYYVVKKGTQRMVSRYVLAEDFKCKYCGSMASIREARGFIAVIANANLLVTLPCLKCEALLAMSVMLCNRILVACPLTKSDRI
jgi:hypothetical protein